MMLDYKGDYSKRERDREIYRLVVELGCSAKQVAPMFGLGHFEVLRIVSNMKYNVKNHLA